MENVSRPTPVAGRPGPSPPGPETGVPPPLTPALLSCGGIGAFLFTGIYLLEGLTRPGYDAWRQPISALSLGPGGWVQQANFVAFGMLMVLSAVGWYRFLTSGRGWTWFPVLQGISGYSLIGAGISSMDPFPGYPPGVASTPSTVPGTLHLVFAWVLIVTLALGCVAPGVVFWRLPYWRGWAVYSFVTGGLILLFWGLFVGYPTGTLSGLVERLSAGSHALWLCLVTAAVLVQRWGSPGDG